MTYPHDVTIDTDHGQLEDVPAVFDYTAAYEYADPSVGYAGGWVLERTAELLSFKIGIRHFTRDDLVAMASEDEAKRIEEWVSEQIGEELRMGGLEAGRADDARYDTWAEVAE